MFEKILIPTDLSEHSLSVCEYACDLAKKYNSEIHLLHIIDDFTPILNVRTFEMTEEKIRNLQKSEAQKEVNKIKKDLEEKLGREMITEVKSGVNHIEIIKYAEENAIGLILLASHGRTGLIHTLLGSVAEKVIRYAKCPVMVITPTKTY
ncbi:MAG: universal stress protein [Ignavibacteriaceae bacterium]|nr:universal stress protein [Ignavibacteriaceae bacterium]